MSDELKYSVTTGREVITKEIDRLRTYFTKIGYTVTKHAVAEVAIGGRVVSIKGSIQAKSSDDYIQSFTTEIPVGVGGSEDYDPSTSLLPAFFPDIDRLVP